MKIQGEQVLGYPPIEELLPKSGYSIYKLVRMAANRAMELADGKPKLIETPSSDNAPTVALEEIRAGKVVKSVSVTTRPRRAGEVPGRDYIFMGQKGFLGKQADGHFLESQKVFDSYYGTPARNVEQFLRKGKHVLLCIDVKGAREIWRKRPDAFKIFIKTPTVKVLKDRLKRRATENPKDLAFRLKTARKELAQAKYYDFVVVNDDLKKAYRKLEKWICAKLCLTKAKRP